MRASIAVCRRPLGCQPGKGRILSLLVVCGITLAAFSCLPAQAQGFEGTYYAIYTGPAGQALATLELRPDKRAVMTSEYQGGREREVRTGSWSSLYNRITIQFGRLNDRPLKDTIILENQGFQLVSVVWERDHYGKRGLTFRRQKPSLEEERPPADTYLGTYYSSYQTSGGRVDLKLEVRRGGEARMTSESARDRRSNLQTGRWEQRGNRLIINFERLNGRRYRETLELERRGRDLVATQWDRDKYGRDGLRFSTERPSAPDFAGTYYSSYQGDRGTVKLELEVRRNGDVTMISRPPAGQRTVIRTGKWETRGDWLVLRFERLNGNRYNETMELERRGEELVAVVYDRNLYGRQALRFSTAPPSGQDFEGTYSSEYQSSRGKVEIELEISQGGEATMTSLFVSERRRSVQTGKWKASGNRLTIEFDRLNGNRYQELLELERRGTELIAVTFDRDKYGRTALRFTITR